MSDSTVLLEEPEFILRIICVFNKIEIELVHCILSLLYPNKTRVPLFLSQWPHTTLPILSYNSISCIWDYLPDL